MNDSPPDDSHLLDAEAKMRRALGLTGDTSVRSTPNQSIIGGNGSHPQRRQFVRDGDVPVTIIHHQSGGESSNQLEAARNAMRSLAAAKERAERLFEQAQAQVRDLQTKLGHERLATDEAIGRANSGRRASEQALETVRTELAAERIAHEQSEQALREARSIITNLTEELHGAQRALDAERQKAQEAARKPTAASAVDVSPSGDEPAQAVRGPRGRRRKNAVVQTVEKPARAVATTYPPAIGDEPVRTVRRPRGRPRKLAVMETVEKPASRRREKPVRWWLGER